MKQLAEALLKCASSIKGIEKNMQVGGGSYGYKAVSDYDVKQAVRKAMFENGLMIIPTNIDAKTHIETWQDGNKRKQSVMAEVVTTYTLLHVSGESLQVQGYGHGVDTADKAAGKATTYALKYALLYLNLVPVGTIDDSDSEHSNDKELPIQKKKIGEERFTAMIASINLGKYTKEEAFAAWDLTPSQARKLNALVKT